MKSKMSTKPFLQSWETADPTHDLDRSLICWGQDGGGGQAGEQAS